MVNFMLFIVLNCVKLLPRELAELTNMFYCNSEPETWTNNLPIIMTPIG